MSPAQFDAHYDLIQDLFAATGRHLPPGVSLSWNWSEQPDVILLIADAVREPEVYRVTIHVPMARARHYQRADRVEELGGIYAESIRAGLRDADRMP